MLAESRRREALLAVLRCPLSGELPADPYVLADGTSYERAAAVGGRGIQGAHARTNVALRQLVEEVLRLSVP